MAQMQACQACGATIYPEHIDQGRAGRWAGQMLCAVCYAQKRAEDADAPAAVAQPVAPAPSQPPLAQVAQPVEPVDEDEPISLEDVPSGSMVSSKIQTIGGQMSTIVGQRKQFKRIPAKTGQGACRVRTFHSKLQIESIEFMDNAINEWLDDNPDIEVKFVTTTIGTMAGKFPEPNLILNVWY